MNGNGFSSTDLDTLQRQKTAWRRAQQGRSRLPEELWAAAATIAGSQGVSWVARVLHLDYYKLKRRCPKGAGDTSRPTHSQTFVEVQLEPPISLPTARWHIELRDESTARLSIEMGSEIPALLALVEAFWKRRP